MISRPYRDALLLWYTKGGDIIMFVALSLALALYIGQEKIVTRGEPLYWALTIPALMFPLLRIRQTLENLLFGVARPFMVLGIASAAWLVIQGDIAPIPPLVLIVLVSGWACRAEARVSLKWLVLLFLLFYATGVARYITQPPITEFSSLTAPWNGEPIAAETAPWNGAPTATDEDFASPTEEKQELNINAWGILPEQTAPAYGPWRISITPNIAASGIISIFAMLIAIGHFRFSSKSVVSLFLVSTYFTVLSFVRSATIGLAIFTLSQILLRITHKIPRLRMLISFSIVFGLISFAAIAPYVLYQLQDIPLISRLLLRGQTGLSVQDIYRQAYRPWLWMQHIQLFWHSDYFMGLGSDLAKSVTSNVLNSGHIRSDSISFPTRLLATYGLPAIALFYFMVERCYAHAKNDDLWAISMLGVIFWLMMTWGSVFHPTNCVFALAILIAGKGTAGFTDGKEQATQGH